MTWAMGATFLTTLTAPLMILPILSFWSASEEKEREVGCAFISKSGYTISGYNNFILIIQFIYDMTINVVLRKIELLFLNLK
jgi:hypothetical protein